MTSSGGDMNGKRPVLRVGEYLVGRASRYLPRSTREQRHQEWSAELPVILDDPGVRPAARRAVRMLGFAADTLRGAAVARYTAAGRHVNPHPARKPAGDRVTREAPLALLAFPVLLGLCGYLLYAGVSGATLTFDVVYLLLVLACVLVSLAAQRPLTVRNYGFSAGLVVMGTGQLLRDLAHHFGWGHPLLFLVIAYGGQVALSLAVVSSLATLTRAARARFRKART
jgi:hypothetical protein